MKNLNVGIAGATGAVGQEMIKVLEKRNFPLESLHLFASERSAGKKVSFRNETLTIKTLTKDFYKGLDIVLFATEAEISKEFAPLAADNGVIVIDNSSAFRMDENIPLVVPEINSHKVNGYRGIIANPNCSTIQLCVALYPIHQKYKIKKLIVSTYQAASGAGSAGMEELLRQTGEYSEGKYISVNKFQHQLLFNVIPHIDKFTDNSYTKEEMKIVNETKKIFDDNSLKISATAVRVPVMRAHSESVTAEVEREFEIEEVKNLLAGSPGIILEDEPENNIYPMPLFTAERFETCVGRVRRDLAFDNGISLWIVADQLLKGAALNAVQIAELYL